MEEVPYVPPPKRVFRLTRVGELDYKEPVYLVADFVEAECLSMIFGDPGCGKSFLGVDLALSVATGTSFHGRKVLTGPVVYLAGEGHNGLIRRVEAWSKERKVDVSECPLFLSQSAAQFLNDTLVREVAEAVEKVKDKFGPPRLIVVDTVARSFGGGDENSTSDMTKFVAALDQFRETYGCTILLVHHSGHTEKKRARGNMALKGALDAEYRVEKKGQGIVIECTKMKDAPEPKPIHFSLCSVELAIASDGKPITSAVLRPSVDFSSDFVKKMTDTQVLAINAYEAAVLAVGKLRDDGSFAGIHVEDWRDQFYRKHTGDSIDTKRKAFNRARKDLVELRRFKVDNDVYFPAGDFPALDEAPYVDIIKKRDAGQ
jgi:KaiC/GvpD/RAD55 family RecA-like ATPase